VEELPEVLNPILNVQSSMVNERIVQGMKREHMKLHGAEMMLEDSRKLGQLEKRKIFNNKNPCRNSDRDFYWKRKIWIV